jgi:NADH-quinone oxidoreductase subunit J
MTPVQVIFIATAAMILVSALLVVTRKNLVHAALYLVLTLLGIAITYILLEANFLAVVQILVYIGAIAILMIFAVMLTRNVVGEDGEVFGKYSKIAIAVAFLVFEGLVVTINAMPQFKIQSPPVVDGATLAETLPNIGVQLFSADGYLIPTMVASMLLLAALLGAVVVAWQREN